MYIVGFLLVMYSVILVFGQLSVTVGRVGRIRVRLVSNVGGVRVVTHLLFFSCQVDFWSANFLLFYPYLCP